MTFPGWAFPPLPEPGIDTDDVPGLDALLTRLSRGYIVGSTLYYTADNTFTKAAYPGLRAIRVGAQGAGGGAAGCGTTAAGEASMGCAGHGGGYAESLILVSNLDTTEAITVGVGGAGGIGVNGGTTGEDSVFDTISGEVRGVGGTGGLNLPASATATSNNGNQPNGGTGDLVIYGEAIPRYCVPPTAFIQHGGRSHLGAGGVGDTNANGGAGQGYGGGGGSCGNNASQGSARTGGAGSDGIVIVTLLY